MDERKIKRLLITLAMAVAIIMVSKFLMIKAATNLGKAAQEKKRPGAVQQGPAPVTATLPLISPESGASTVEETAAVSSSVDTTGR